MKVTGGIACEPLGARPSDSAFVSCTVSGREHAELLSHALLGPLTQPEDFDLGVAI